MKKIILLAMLFATITFGQSTSSQILLGFWNSAIDNIAETMPEGYLFLKDADGKYIKDADGKYMTVPTESHLVAYYFWTTDGIPILVKGESGFDSYRLEIPELIMKDDSFFVFYSGWEGTNNSIGAIGLAVGITLDNLVKRGAILSNSETGWDGGYVSGQRIYYEDGTYYLYYFGANIPGFEARPAHIGVATSTDLYNWTKYESNPILETGEDGEWDDNILYRPFMMKFNSTYYLFYNAGDGSNERIGVATANSPLGEFIKYAGNPIMNMGAFGAWNDNRIGDMQILNYNNTWVMFYYGARIWPDRGNIGIAVSNNLITWTQWNSNPLNFLGTLPQYHIRPSIVELNNRWIMLYDDVGENIYKAYSNYF